MSINSKTNAKRPVGLSLRDKKTKTKKQPFSKMQQCGKRVEEKDHGELQ
jgi:hypothetical protein